MSWLVNQLFNIDSYDALITAFPGKNGNSWLDPAAWLIFWGGIIIEQWHYETTM